MTQFGGTKEAPWLQSHYWQAEDWVTLDWDELPKGLEIEDRLRRVPEQVNWILENAGPVHLKEAHYRIWYRRSSNKRGGWHVRIEFDCSLRQNVRFALRKRLWDDTVRLAWDLTRVMGDASVDYSKGVLFDMKNGRRAHTWIRYKKSFMVMRGNYSKQ